jgi:two-component system sensor histidine kinase AlgZ
MHPIFATARGVGMYLLAWLFPIALVVYMLLVSAHLTLLEAISISFPLCLVYAVVCLSPWYTCRVLPLRRTSAVKLVSNHLVAAAVIAFFWTKLASGLAWALQRFWPDLPVHLEPHWPLILGVGVLLYSLAVALHYTYLELEAARDAIRREHVARVLAREAELKALKAQINPHFLFNCLNSISALTSIDPGQAREMCIRLSDFLRNTLRLGEKVAIPFADEIALVRTYLDVEQVRFGARLRVEQRIDASCERCVVPPLLLQPLVENAVKHGVASLMDGGFIRIQSSCGDKLLRIVVENDFDPENPSPKRSGLGLANVRSRIETRHGNRGSMQVTVVGTSHRVELVLPCEI